MVSIWYNNYINNCFKINWLILLYEPVSVYCLMWCWCVECLSQLIKQAQRRQKLLYQCKHMQRDILTDWEERHYYEQRNVTLK